MSKKLCFFWGFFGATLPEILKLKDIVSGPIQKIEFYSINYLLISLAFACAAGLLSIAWEPENPTKAIWFGVSFPIIIQTMGLHLPS